MRQSPQQVQLALNPSEYLFTRRQELDPSQSPQVSNRCTTEMAKQARMRHQEMYHECDTDRCSPRRDRVPADREVWVLSICLDRFDREQKEDEHACADGGRVAAEDEALEQCVQAAWEQTEGSSEEDEGYDRAVLGFEALEERRERGSIEEEVEDRFMQKRKSVQSVD